MSVSLDDLANPENALDINMWNWRPTIALIGLTRLIDAERLELMGYNGTGVEIIEAEAHAIGRFLETEVLPALRPGTRLTYDLIVSIFQPSSPLHDGAAIVQGDRIAAAACFLPLRVNPRLARELGSRHRAALGVTEENDAVALVVSEESGTVSLVLDGKIERGLTPDKLRWRLRALIKRTQARPERRIAAATMD